MTAEDFISFVRKECKYFGVKVYLTKGKDIRIEQGKCRGFFDDELRQMKVAMGNDLWLETMAHEYCHMTQWAEKSPTWVASFEHKSYVAWQRHINGKAVDIDFHFDIIRDLELDNEKRTVSLIKKLNLPIDVRHYTKMANSYIMFYNFMKTTGRWCNKAPYQSKAILDAMPDKFSLDYSKMSKKLQNLYTLEGI